MKKILITGSAGFIFSNFVRKALYDKIPYEIISIDACKNPNVLNNVYSNKNHRFYIGDVTDSHFVNVVFEVERPDIVLHSAAETHVDESISKASPFIQTNVFGTQVIIDACLKWGVERLIYCSTDEVYGHLTQESDPSWAESATINPRNPYSASKAGGELLIKAAHETHGLNYQITRSCNNYGPRQQGRNLIPKIIRSILTNEKMPIFGQGRQSREWMHVSDHYNAILKILECGKLNEVYNISTNHEFSNLEVFYEICKIMERGNELLTFVDERPGHDYRYSVNSEKLRALGWKPELKFKQGLYQTVQWYQINQWALNIKKTETT